MRLAFLLISAIGGFLFGYDTGVVAGAMLFIDVHGCDVPRDACTSARQSAIVGVALVAAALSSPLGGALADWLGRKHTIILSSVLFAFGGGGLSANRTLSHLLLARVIVGVAIGIASQTIPMYISELSPARMRGSMVAFFQLMITLGILIAAIVDLAFAERKDWRSMFGLSVIPALSMAAGMCCMPETPRWFVSRGRNGEALAVLERICLTEMDARSELDDMHEVVQAEKTAHSRLRALLRPLAVGASLQIFAQLQGINTVIYFAPTILKKAGFSERGAIGGLVAIDGCNVILTVVSVLCMDRIKRRTWLFISGSGMILIDGAFICICTSTGRAPEYPPRLFNKDR